MSTVIILSVGFFAGGVVGAGVVLVRQDSLNQQLAQLLRSTQSLGYMAPLAAKTIQRTIQILEGTST